MTTNNLASWLPTLLGPVNLAAAQQAGQKYVVRWDPSTGLYSAELPAQTPDGLAGELVGLDGNGGLANVQPSGLTAGDLFYWNGTALVKVGGSPDGTSTYTLKRVAGVPTWVSDAVAFTPAGLSLTGYWKDYATDPWTGTASAGSSGGRTLPAVSPAAVGTSFGSHASADFNGSTAGAYLQTSYNWDTLTTRAAYYLEIIFQADTVAAAGAQPYGDAILLGDNGGNLYVGLSSSGLRYGHYDDTAFQRTAFVACATGSKHCAQCWFDGANLNLRLDGGTVVTQASANFTSAFNAIKVRVGVDQGSTNFFDGRIARIITANAVPSSTVRDQLLADARANYGTI